MKADILICTGNPVEPGTELSLGKIQREFAGASPELATIMMQNPHLVEWANRTHGTLQSDYGSRLPLSPDLHVWMERMPADPKLPLHTILRARCPEVDTLLFISKRLGSLLKGYKAHVKDGVRYFAVANTDLQSHLSSVMAVVPIPNW